MKMFAELVALTHAISNADALISRVEDPTCAKISFDGGRCVDASYAEIQPCARMCDHGPNGRI